MAQWFAPKRYGYGAGLPIAWQGWAVLASYLALVITVALIAGERTDVAMSIIIPATLLLILVAARTTRGGWRWRWGEKG